MLDRTLSDRLYNLLSSAARVMDSEYFKFNYTFFLNIAFLIISVILIYIGYFRRKDVEHHKEMAPKSPWLENTLGVFAAISYLWLLGGITVKLLGF